MAEIIGVAASATQLATACFSLIDVVKKIKGGTSTLRTYQQQLRDLRNLSTCIAGNPLLQTPEVGVQTQAILFIIKNNCLNSLLQKGRLLRTWGLIYREQDLLETFAQLERQKTNLSLAIEHIQSKVLYQIRVDVHKMAERQGSNSPASNALAMSDMPQPGPQRPSQVVDTPITIPSPTPLDPNFVHRVDTFSRQHQPDPRGQGHASMSTQPNQHGSRSNTASQYRGMIAGAGVTQQNGGRFMMSASTSQEISSNRVTPSVHISPVKIGDGNQFNGHEIVRTDNEPGFQVPDTSEDIWINGRMWSSPPPTGTAGTQFNGNLIREFNPDQDK
ncbi:hypothetical protein FALBO_9327 [Fusarium albosuccineum]|uniref:Fungal N-terminal domain-containing protein n=1 Tax=Fusarium albosuccineum TaxID=1237068 RepID=A0A8H4LA20_9HYPO|nr:hypothetical protein FALBO_9327 [Fusarium albosuccineum]